MGHVGRPALSVLAVALLMVAGCGSSSKSSSTTTVTTATTSPGTTSGGSTTTIVGTAELCADRTALRQSIQDLEHVQVITNGTSALEDALNKVKDNVDALKQSAHGVLQQPTQEFEDSLST
ncbi:MAG TPA: hypothetical protein VL119_06790, partial [Acidimicrobiia bacterium]|nr:hypothetical protein [Acidimicrobiia bacterium]